MGIRRILRGMRTLRMLKIGSGSTGYGVEAEEWSRICFWASQYCIYIYELEAENLDGAKYVKGQVSPGFWRQHEVIKTRLASNEEIQTNENGFHTIVVRIYKL
jgi:hypothetical protein